jgi:hypothetical protein
MTSSTRGTCGNSRLRRRASKSGFAAAALKGEKKSRPRKRTMIGVMLGGSIVERLSASVAAVRKRSTHVYGVRTYSMHMDLGTIRGRYARGSAENAVMSIMNEIKVSKLLEVHLWCGFHAFGKLIVAI